MVGMGGQARISRVLFNEGKTEADGWKDKCVCVLKYPTQLVFLKRWDGFLLHSIMIDVWQHDRRGEQEANPHTLYKHCMFDGENIY